MPRSLAQVIVDPLDFDDAVAALRRYSLLEKAGDALSVHRLVQAVARDRLTDEARRRFDGAHHRTWAEAAVCLVDDASPFDSDEVQTWPVCARLLPHALAAASHAEKLSVAPEATGRLLNQAGLYLGGRAEFAAAKAAYERALAAYEQVLDEQHPWVATIINNLRSVLLQGDGKRPSKSCLRRMMKSES